jgi:type IV pilus assembly protein PilP
MTANVTGVLFDLMRQRSALLLLTVFSIAACDEIERAQLPGFVGLGGASQKGQNTGSSAKGAANKPLDAHKYTDEDFVESDTNRDPFRAFTTLFKAEAPQTPQRQVAMSNTSIEEMRLIAIVSGTPTPKAMLVDPLGVGHVVERGMFIGKPQIVRASENVLLTLNWRVDRIRPNEVVLTREDPTDPNRPPLTRVIPMKEEVTGGQ